VLRSPPGSEGRSSGGRVGSSYARLAYNRPPEPARPATVAAPPRRPSSASERLGYGHDESGGPCWFPVVATTSAGVTATPGYKDEEGAPAATVHAVSRAHCLAAPVTRLFMPSPLRRLRHGGRARWRGAVSRFLAPISPPTRGPVASVYVLSGRPSGQWMPSRGCAGLGSPSRPDRANWGFPRRRCPRAGATVVPSAMRRPWPRGTPRLSHGEFDDRTRLCPTAQSGSSPAHPSQR
jgi:hypothetical protein